MKGLKEIFKGQNIDFHKLGINCIDKIIDLHNDLVELRHSFIPEFVDYKGDTICPLDDIIPGSSEGYIPKFTDEIIPSKSEASGDCNYENDKAKAVENVDETVYFEGDYEKNDVIASEEIIISSDFIVSEEPSHMNLLLNPSDEIHCTDDYDRLQEEVSQFLTQLASQNQVDEINYNKEYLIKTNE